MVKLKLKALLIPKEFEQIDASNIDPRKYVKFLYIVDSTANLESLEEKLVTRFSKRYPRERKLRVLAFQNKDLCDLDPDFAVEDVFSESNDELRVLVDNKFRSITYTPDPAISTPINFSQAETIRGGVYSAVEKSDDNTTPKKPKKSPLSSPVSLAPPPPPPETKSNRKVPQKKNAVSLLKQRITSGMLEAPPVTPMNNSDEVYFDRLESPIKKPQKAEKTDSFIVSSSQDEISSSEEYNESEELDTETVDYEPEGEEEIQPSELLSMFEELDSQENNDLPLSRSLNSKLLPINKELQIDMVEGNPAMYLSRSKRRAAREANLVFTASKKAAKAPFSTTKPASTSKITSKPGKVQKPTISTHTKNTLPVVNTNAQSKSVSTPTQNIGIEKKIPVSNSSKPINIAGGKSETKTAPTIPQLSNKASSKQPNNPFVSKSTLEDLYDRMKVFGEKVKTLMVNSEDGKIIGYEKIPSDFGDGIKVAYDISSEAIDTTLRLTRQKNNQDTSIVEAGEIVLDSEILLSNSGPSLQLVETALPTTSEREVESKANDDKLANNSSDDIVIKPPVKNKVTNSTKAVSKDLDSDNDFQEIPSTTAIPSVDSTKPIAKELDSYNDNDDIDIDIKTTGAVFVPVKTNTEASAPLATIVDSSEEERENNKIGIDSVGISRELLNTLATVINNSKKGNGHVLHNSSNSNKNSPDIAPSTFAGDYGNEISGNNTPNRLNYNDNEMYIPKSFAANFRANERNLQMLGSLQIIHKDDPIDKTPTKNDEPASDHHMLQYMYVGDSGVEDMNTVGRGIDDKLRSYNKSSGPLSPFGKTDTSSSFLFAGSNTSANTSIPKPAFGAGDLFAGKTNNGNGTNNNNNNKNVYRTGNNHDNSLDSMGGTNTNHTTGSVWNNRNGTGVTSGSVHEKNSSIPSAQQQVKNNINLTSRATLQKLSLLQNLVNLNKRTRPESESEESDDGDDEDDEDQDEPNRVRKKSKLIASTPIPKPTMTPLSGNGNKLRFNLTPWSSKAKPVIPKPIPAPNPNPNPTNDNDNNNNDDVRNANPLGGVYVINQMKNKLLSSLTDLANKGLPDVKDTKTVTKKPLTIFGDSSDSEGNDDDDSDSDSSDSD